MAEVTDIRKVWRKQKRRKRFWHIVLLLAAVALLAVIAGNWSAISSWFVLPDASNNLYRQADGYPLEVGGTKVCQIASDENTLLVVSDVSANRYQANGKRYTYYAHSLSDPRGLMNGSWSLVYSPGATKATLYHTERKVNEYSTGDTILLAAVSKEGQTAIATGSGLYSSKLVVRDQNQKEQLTMTSEEQVTALSFHSDCKKLAVGTITTKNGALTGTIRQLTVGSDKADWVVSIPDEWILGFSYEGDGRLIAVGSKGVYLFGTDGKQRSQYIYPATLKSVAVNQKRVCLSTETADPAQSRTVLLNGDFKTIVEDQIDGETRSISLAGEQAIVVTDKTVLHFSEDGTRTAYITDGSIRYAAWLEDRCIGVSDLLISELKIADQAKSA